MALSERSTPRRIDTPVLVREYEELIGLARGLTADGLINQLEAEFLDDWLADHLHLSDKPAVRALYDRIAGMLVDDALRPDEAADLFQALADFGRAGRAPAARPRLSTLALCVPAPAIVIPDRSFCFTGAFDFGDRDACTLAVLARGGSVGDLATDTHYLVVGTYASDDWHDSLLGDKLVKATEYRSFGHPVRIVSEDKWVAAL